MGRVPGCYPGDGCSNHPEDAKMIKIIIEYTHNPSSLNPFLKPKEGWIHEKLKKEFEERGFKVELNPILSY